MIGNSKTQSISELCSYWQSKLTGMAIKTLVRWKVNKIWLRLELVYLEREQLLYKFRLVRWKVDKIKWD